MKQLVELHAESHGLGQGATFIVEVRLLSIGPAEPLQAEAKSASRIRRKVRVDHIFHNRILNEGEGSPAAVTL